MIEDRVKHWPGGAIPCFLALTILFGIPTETLMIHAGRADMADHLVV